MKKEIIEDALLSAISLLNNEAESVVIDDLKDEYLIVMEKLKNGLKELEWWELDHILDVGNMIGMVSAKRMDHFPESRTAS